MMRTDTIRKGSYIETLSGYLLVTGWNGSIIYCEEHETIDDDDDFIVGESMLTESEIAHLMKGVDGRNHKVIYESE